MDPTNENLENAYVADVVRRTSRAFHPRDKEEKALDEKFSKDLEAGIDPRNTASYEQLKEYRREKAQKPFRKIAVSLSLLIERDGSVHDIELIESSEYEFVNEAALAAPRYAARFRPVPRQFKCPYKVYVKLYCNVVDSSVSAPLKKDMRRSRRHVDGQKLAEVVDRFGGWQKLMSPEFEITEEILSAVELEAFMDRKTFLSMKATELMNPRAKELHRAAADLYCAWHECQRRGSPRIGEPTRGSEEWERILKNFWHYHGPKMDELGVSLDDVVTEIETDAKAFPNANTLMFTELAKLRRPYNEDKET